MDLVPAAALEDGEIDMVRDHAERHNTKSFRIKKRSMRGLPLDGGELPKPRTLVHLALRGDEDGLDSEGSKSSPEKKAGDGQRLLRSTASRARITDELQAED